MRKLFSFSCRDYIPTLVTVYYNIHIFIVVLYETEGKLNWTNKTEIENRFFEFLHVKNLHPHKTGIKQGKQTNRSHVFPNYPGFLPTLDDIEVGLHGRSQLNGHGWPESGMIILYPEDTYPERDECTLHLAVFTINKYSCLPIHLYKIKKECATVNETLKCMLKFNKEPLLANTIQQMTASGNDPNILKDYIVIVGNTTKCSSFIGRQGGRQVLNLGIKGYCATNVGTPIHEMTHALGYHHEQTRLDRDNYIVINNANILPDHLHNFDKQPPLNFSEYGPYDFRSIMHYDFKGFSKDSSKLNTMDIKAGVDPKVDPSQIGRPWELTVVDKAKIRAATKCSGATFHDHAEEVRKIDKKDEDFEIPPPKFLPDSTNLQSLEIKLCGPL